MAHPGNKSECYIGGIGPKKSYFRVLAVDRS